MSTEQPNHKPCCRLDMETQQHPPIKAITEVYRQNRLKNKAGRRNVRREGHRAADAILVERAPPKREIAKNNKKKHCHNNVTDCQHSRFLQRISDAHSIEGRFDIMRRLAGDGVIIQIIMHIGQNGVIWCGTSDPIE